MSASLATLLCELGILGLFYLDRDKSTRTSWALWIPSIWFLILCSRPVSMWLGGGASAPTIDQQIEGSPTERLIFTLFIAVGLVVLIRRGRRATSLLVSNWPILLYFAYCLLSVAWSDFPEVALKRWIKSTCDIVVALVILTDVHPIAALQRLFSRVGFVLLPASILLIRYYPNLGRSYDSWTGEPFNTGVTTNKNSLGLLAYLFGLGTVWVVLRLWKDKDAPNRTRRLIAQSILLGFAIWVLFTAHSATSGTCFTLGAIVMLIAGWRRIAGRPRVMHALVLSAALLAVLIQITGANAIVLQILGRKPDLTGRADYIWPTVIPMNPNALLGAGFESFWMGSRLQYMWDKFPHLYLNEAHNGYIEMYLNLGLIGEALLIVILIDGYRKCVAAFRTDPSAGSLMLAYTLMAAMYSVTEAGFRMLDTSWSFLLLAIFGATRIAQLSTENPQPDILPSPTPILSAGRPRILSARVKT